jgi:hypothetical protein
VARIDGYVRTECPTIFNLRICNILGMLYYIELIFFRISLKIAGLDHKTIVYTSENITLRKCSKDIVFMPFHLLYLSCYRFATKFSSRVYKNGLDIGK